MGTGRADGEGKAKEAARAAIHSPLLEDVSIVGFDDIDYASVIDPPLTTMRQPRASLGRLAAEDLLQRMGRDAVDVPPIRERLRCDLIERETVGPVATARSVRRPAKLQREGSGAARGGVT